MKMPKKWVSRVAGLFAAGLIFLNVMPLIVFAQGQGSWSGNSWSGKPWEGETWEGSDWEGSDWKGEGRQGGGGHDGSSHQGGGAHEGSSHEGGSHSGSGGHTGDGFSGDRGHSGTSHEGHSHSGSSGYFGGSHTGEGFIGAGSQSGSAHEGSAHDGWWWLGETGGVLAKSGIGYIAHQHGHRLLGIYDGGLNGKLTGYFVTGRKDIPNPVLNLLRKIGRKPLIKGGQEVLKLGVRNHYNSFLPSLKFHSVAKGNIALSSAVGLYSAYTENNGNVLSSGFLASAITEAGFAWGTVTVASATGSALAGWAAGALGGAAIGSSVPLVGTVIGAVVGVGISAFLATETGQKIKNAVKKGIKKGIDGIVSGAKKVGGFVKGLFGK